MVKYKTPKGTRDFLPEEMAKRKIVRKLIESVFERYGFQQIQTPIFEEFALFAARSGEEIREGMITFVYEDKEYALRPELTAPVCRMVVAGKFQKMPKPYRVYYIGQCFRYEQPQAGRYREFEQAGLELMGSPSPICDAEVMTIAVRVLEELGISPFLLKVGNIGIFRDILSEKGFDFDRQNQILGDIDKLMGVREKCNIIKNEKKLDTNYLTYIKGKLEEIYSLQEKIEYNSDYKIPLEKEFNEKIAKNWANKLPQYLDDTYKWCWVKDMRMSEDLANLLLQISYVRGEKKTVKEKAEKLLKGTSAINALNNLLCVCNWLDSFGVQNYEVVLGVARGLDFYTGTVFEIDCPILGTEKQICGGGRYDRLVAEFGGEQIPATGFAFGFDRIVEALEKTKEIELEPKIDIYIVTISDDLKPIAVNVSEKLRKKGIKVEIDVMGRDLRGQLGYASEVGAKHSIILGPDEVKRKKAIVKDMKTGSQTEIEMDNIEGKIERILSKIGCE